MKPGDRAIGIDWAMETAVAGEVTKKEYVSTSQCSIFYINGYSARCGVVRKQGLYVYVLDRCTFGSLDAALAAVEARRAKEIERVNSKINKMRKNVMVAAKRAGWDV